MRIPALDKTPGFDKRVHTYTHMHVHTYTCTYTHLHTKVMALEVTLSPLQSQAVIAD